VGIVPDQGVERRESIEAGERASHGFRRARPSDVDALWKLRELVLRAMAPGTYSRRQLDAWVRSRGRASFASALAGDDEIFIVAEDDEGSEISGFASVIVKGRPHLWSLYVRPSRQGRGIGRRLLRAAEAECAALHLDQLNAAAALTAATFYEAMGYRLVCEFDTELSSDDGEAEHLVLRHYRKYL
jgi:ribosomal protein S18 acetylase RimI-like enzyme